MKQYTGAQWLLINLATHYGMDKDVFDDRLTWGRKVLTSLRKARTYSAYTELLKPYLNEADVPEEFAACAIAIWDVLQGNESNYVVGLDACNSGAQIMSCMGRCITGMANTGLLNTGVRPDLYNEITKNIDGFEADRSVVKTATVPHLYGSRAEPKRIFGEGHFPKFLEACKKTMPMVEFLKDTLIPCWDSKALFHQIILPDAGVAHMIVIDKVQYTGHFKGFSYNFYVEENKPIAFPNLGSTSLGANTIHPYDAYILRELERRCDYNPKTLKYAKHVLEAYLADPTAWTMIGEEDAKLVELCKLSALFNIVSFRGIEHVVRGKMGGITVEYAAELLSQINEVILHSNFKLKCIHDEFGALPNYINSMRKHYAHIMANTYKSTWVFDIIKHLSGVSYHHMLPPVDPLIVEAILDNDYAIC